MRIYLNGNCRVQIFVRGGDEHLEVLAAWPILEEPAKPNTSLGLRALKFVTVCLAVFAVVGTGFLVALHPQEPAPAVAMLPEAQASSEPGPSATLPPAVQDDLAGPALITPPPGGSPHGPSPNASGASAFGLQP